MTEPATESRVSNLSCRRCGYDLSGLPISGECPECSYSIALSHDLWFLRPPQEVLQRIRWGAMIAALGMAAPVLGALLAITTGFWIVALLTIPAGILIFTVGAWLISSYLGSRSAAHLEAERKFLRFGLIVTLVCGLGFIASILDLNVLMGVRITVGIFSALGFCIFGFIAWATLFSALDTLATTALNAPRLGAACRWSLVALVLAVVCIPIMFIIPSLLPTTTALPFFPAPMIFLGMCIFDAALLIAVSARTARILRT